MEAPDRNAMGTLEVTANAPCDTEQVSVVARNACHIGPREFPLSIFQRRLWHLHQSDWVTGPLYRLSLALRLQGKLDKKALKAALNQVLVRHEVLRGTFVRTEGELKQVVGPETLGFFLIEQEAEDESSLQQILLQEMSEPFDLFNGPLIRGRLVRISGQEQILLISYHRIAADRWSGRLILQEIFGSYRDSKECLREPLRSLPIQYSAFSARQQGALQMERLRKQLEYWKRQLSSCPALLQLQTDHPRPAIQSFAGKRVSIHLPQDLVNRLNVFAQDECTTLFDLLLSCWALVLGRLAGQDDVVIGTLVANRDDAEWGSTVGCFENVLALRVRFQGNQTVAELLKDVRATVENAHTNKDAPFEEVVEALRIVRSHSHSPVFQATMTLNDPASKALEAECQVGNLRIAELPDGHACMRHDLSLSLRETPEELIGELEYNSDLFELATIERVAARWQVALQEVVADASRPVKRIPLLAAGERNRILGEFNKTAVPYPQGTFIHQLIEAQVVRTPNAIAVCHGEKQLSYADLNSRANQLARYLRKRGVSGESLVGLYIELSVEFVVGLLAVLKAGGAYVPLDPAIPIEGLNYLLVDAAPRVLLTRKILKARIATDFAEMVALDSDWYRIADLERENLNSSSQAPLASQLAYVIYTSGSTGKPKGVMVEHRNIVNYAIYATRRFNVAAGNGSLVCTSASFDLMLTGLYPPLLCGRTVRICSSEAGLPDIRGELLRCSNLSIMKLTPSHLGLLEHLLLSDEIAGCLYSLVVGGETLLANSITAWRKYAPNIRIFNHYGPTETTVGCAVYELTDPIADPVPIGKPIDNTRIYILDQDRQPVPIGIVGEIYVAGAGVTRGYLSDPELTSQRFLLDPFANDDPRARMYKTGDMARWRADGNIEFLGRRDEQVKVRGYRVELAEIREMVIRHERVQDAVVIVGNDAIGEKRLLAYATLRESQGGNTGAAVDELRDHLRIALPTYMIPSAIIVMESLPITVNGKLDRDRLPVPSIDAYLTQRYEPPLQGMEQELATLWREVLGVERIGRTDNFFEIGGDSLLGLRLVARITEEFAVDMPLVGLVELPTIQQIAQHIQATAHATKLD